MKKVFIRTFTGLFIVIAVYAIVFLSKYPFVTEAATALLSIAAVYEIFRATGENKKKAPLFISLVVAAIISFAPIPHYEVFACVTLIVAIFVFAAMMRKMETFRFYRTRQSVVMALIVVLLIRAIPTLRVLENGWLYLAFAITVCFLSDILAYFTGKIFGTHQLAPRVSPKKTVEGALGGIVFTTVLVIGLGIKPSLNVGAYRRTEYTAEMQNAGYTILAPQMLPIHFAMLEPVFHKHGYKLEILNNDNRKAIDTGLKYVNNDACFPSITIVGQFMEAITSGRYDTNRLAVLMTQTGGCCRASNYVGFIRRAFDKAGYSHIPVISLSMGGLESNEGFKINLKMVKDAVYSLLLGDLMMRCLSMSQ